DREHDRCQCRRGIQSDQAPQSIGRGRSQATNRISRYHQAPNVGAVVSGVSAQDQVSEPAYKKGTNDRGESNAEQIDTVIMRREQPREDDDAQQPQQCRKDVGGKIDAGLSDQHSASRPAGCLVARPCVRVACISSIAARMIRTGVPENEATEKATSSLPARRSNWSNASLSSSGGSQ